MRQLPLFDKIIEVAAHLALIGLWVIIIASYSVLPDTIPTAYNELGRVYEYGSKSSIFLLPFIGTFIFIILTVLSNSPEVFDYNAVKQHTLMTKMTRVLKLMVVLIFFMINYKTIQTAQKTSDGLGIWLLPLILVLLFMSAGYFMYKSYKKI